jgi:predicted phosphodiesterase
MSTKQWTDIEANIVFNMVEENKLYREISEHLRTQGYTRSSEAVRKFYNRSIEQSPSENIVSSPSQSYMIIEHTDEDEKFNTAIEDIRTLRDSLVDSSNERFVHVGRPMKTTKKILSLSDLHIPFENSNIIKHAISRHSDADILVLNGDILELYSVSKWQKKKEIMLRTEYMMAIEWLKMFSEIFPKVVLVSGNHEDRLKSYFSSRVEPCVSFLVDSDILTKLSRGYDFKQGTIELVPTHNFKNIYYNRHLEWYTRIGNAIFVHPREYSSVIHKTASNFAKHFNEKEKDWQCLVVAHTHKIATSIQNGRLILEQGCCCLPMDYESSGKSKMTSQAFGYAVVYMDDEGNVDYNKSNVEYYGTGSMIKTGNPLELLGV